MLGKQAMGPDQVCQFHHVTCGHGNRTVFTEVDLNLAAGQFAALVGPTGAGKTTLLKAALGLISPQAGEIRVFGEAPGRVRGRIGYVPQLGQVDWNFPMTVERLVLMGLYRQMGRWPWPRRRERMLTHALLERLGIAEYADAPIRELSGGQQQRAFLARALVARPPLLLLDEPTAGVDLSTQHEILHLLGELNGEGITILLTTHDLNAVAAHLPWIICFNQGVVAQGEPETVLTAPVLKQTYLAEILVVEHGAFRFMAHATPLNLRRPGKGESPLGPPH